MRRALGVVAMVAIGTSVCGCPGRLDRSRFLLDAGTDGGPVVCGDVEKTLFLPTCAGGGCHETPNPGGNLDLVSPGIAARIRAATSTCLGKPMGAYILEKVKPSPGCGATMPLGATGEDLLSAAELKCLDDYLAVVADGGF